MKQEFSPEKNSEREILEITNQKLSSLMKRDAMGTYNRTLEKAAELKLKHPDCGKYKMYHVLILSTPDEAISPLFDFPGEDSVEKFIESLEKSPDSKS